MVKVIVVEASTLKIETEDKVYNVSVSDLGIFIQCKDGVRVSEAGKLNTWLFIK